MCVCVCVQFGNQVAQLLVIGPLGLTQVHGHDVFGADHLHHLRKRLAREIDAATLELLNFNNHRIGGGVFIRVRFVQAEQLELRRNGAQVIIIAERGKCHVDGAFVKLGRYRGKRGFRGFGIIIRGSARHLHNAVNCGLCFGSIRIVFLNAGTLAHEKLQRGAVCGFQAARILQERHHDHQFH